MYLEDVCDRNKVVLATLISALEHLPPGHNFPTHHNDELQLGLFNHPKNYEIKRHYHPQYRRNLRFTNEVLIILSGVVEVDLYDNNQEFITSRRLGANSVMILRQGGHGFTIIEDAVIIEVKQGPYAGVQDKVLF